MEWIVLVQYVKAGSARCAQSKLQAYAQFSQPYALYPGVDAVGPNEGLSGS